jgi:hypothetical protein
MKSARTFLAQTETFLPLNWYSPQFGPNNLQLTYKRDTIPPKINNVIDVKMKGKFTAKVKLNGRARDNRSLLPEAIGNYTSLF